MAQPWSWELAATLSWEMLSFWVKMVMVPLIYIHLQTNCSWIWLGSVHLFSRVSQCQGCFSYDRDVANCTATLKQTGRSRRSSHEAWKICKRDHVLHWCNKGTVPMGWFLDWERTTFFDTFWFDRSSLCQISGSQPNGYVTLVWESDMLFVDCRL